MLRHAQAVSGKLAAGTKSRQPQQYRGTHHHIKQILPDRQHLAQAADVLLALAYPMDQLERFAFWGLFGRRLRRAYRGATA
jgi:hypothetical protein